MSERTALADLPPASRRSVYATYAVGLLTDSQSELLSFIIPFWALALGMGPLELGLLVSAKGVLSSILAIHGGVLMDRYGTRLVMVLMGIACTLMPPFFSFATWFPALFVLQMTVGLAMSFSWMGAQSLAVIVARDDTVILGRFSFFARTGVMFAPLLAGILWDMAPHWVSFLSVTLAGGAFWYAVTLLPKVEIDGPDEAEDGSRMRPPFSLRDLIPRLSDYIGTIGLMAIPAVAFVVGVSSARIGSGLMQQSFYIVYLKEIGLQATIIGGFLTLSQFMAAIGTLAAGRLARFINPQWIFVGAVAASVFLVYSTPIYGNVLALLACVIGLRGLCQGISQPVMYTILSRAVGRDVQATAIGLRQTGNRVASLIIPIAMGAIAELWGLNATFYVMGTFLLLICAAMVILIAVSDRRARRNLAI